MSLLAPFNRGRRGDVRDGDGNHESAGGLVIGHARCRHVLAAVAVGMVFLEVGVGQQRGDIVVALCEVVGAVAFRKRGVHLYFQFAAYDAGGKRACRLF